MVRDVMDLAQILCKLLPTANATAEQKARLLEVKGDENAATIEHLRHKHSLLVAEHKKLQQRFNKTMEVCILYSCPTMVDFVESYHTANGQAERRAMSISEISQWQVSHTQPAKAQD